MQDGEDLALLGVPCEEEEGKGDDRVEEGLLDDGAEDFAGEACVCQPSECGWEVVARTYPHGARRSFELAL